MIACFFSLEIISYSSYIVINYKRLALSNGWSFQLPDTGFFHTRI